MTLEPHVPAYARCGACGCGFVYAVTPMPLEVFIVCAKRASCPRCGETKGLLVFDHKPTLQELAR